MKYLLVTPPLTQLNTPYPATTVLKGFLQSHGHEVAQTDLGIELIDSIFSRQWLADYAASCPNPDERQYLTRCSQTIDAVMRFLRGADNTLAPRIANRSLLPEGKRFSQLADMEWAFGTSGTDDKARYLATLFIEDIADHIRTHLDPHFDLIRYAEHLASYAPRFDELHSALQAPLTPIDSLSLSLLDQQLSIHQPRIVGITIPFPGCLYAALRFGQHIKRHHPGIAVALGGGFPNTEWRQLSDPRIFDYCDYINIDDGELPMLSIAQLLQGSITPDQLVRTFTLQNLSTTSFASLPSSPQADFATQPAPDFDGLPLYKYLSLAEMTNPMHRLWSHGRWNKMMMAHGCYWHRCAFCDTSLDYIGRFQAPSAATVVERMEYIMSQTGITGFHFVDEALPPRLLADVCREILNRHLTVSFWGNIRFEKAYTAELCNLMSDAGCVAVSGGLEVASDRLLQLIDKGVTIDQTVQVCRHFRDSGIMVHTYLMYGFPTETLQETLNALEVVRSMFDEGIVQSAFWHRYAMTCHSPSGLNPARYGAMRPDTTPNPFCNNEVDWLPSQPIHAANQSQPSQFDYDIEEVGRGLSLATYNYMNDLGLDQPVRSWFPGLHFPKHKKHHSRQ